MTDSPFRRARKVMIRAGMAETPASCRIITLQDWAPNEVIEHTVKALKDEGIYRAELYLNGLFTGVYLMSACTPSHFTFIPAEVYNEVS